MSRTYSISISAGSLTANSTNPTDLFEILTVRDKPAVRILGLVIGQSSDVGDANSENLSIKISRGWTTSGSGGGTVTAVPLDGLDSAASFATVETLNTTTASAGTEVVLFADVWNTQAGYQMWFPEGVQPYLPITTATAYYTTVRLTAPADTVTISATLFVQEA